MLAKSFLQLSLHFLSLTFSLPLEYAKVFLTLLQRDINRIWQG